MPDKLETIVFTQKNFYEDRPVMKAHNSDPIELANLLMAEVRELAEAIEEGDVDNIPRELADVFIFTLSMASMFEVDIYAEVMEKIMRNYLKYPARNFQEGTYEEARATSKQQWLESKGEEEFYSDTV